MNGTFITEMIKKGAKSQQQPLVSIIMPNYNGEAYIREAIDSLLNQTYKNIEIIVVDDCSKDDSWKIIQEYGKQDKRVRPYKNKQNMKQTRTRNFAISQSKGEFIALLDADDTRTRTSIQMQVNYLITHPDVVVVGGGASFCDDKMNRMNDRLYPTVDAEIRRTFFKYSPFCLASIMVRADVLNKEQAYNTLFEPVEDMDLALRLGMKGKFGNLKEVIYNVRTHRTSVSQTLVRKMELITLYMRLKAVAEYGYTMTFKDKVYFAAQTITMYLMPSRFRFWLFNKLRATN